MTEIQQTRYDQLLRRVANIVSPGSIVGDALNELFPMFDVENMPLELLALSRTNIAMASSRLAASLLDLNHHQLFNPADSNNLLVCHKMLVSSDTTQRIRLSMSQVALTNNVGNVERRDTREGVVALSVGQNRNVQQPGGVPAVLEFTILADTVFTLEDPNGLWVLFPDTGTRLATTTVNTESIVTWFWRERVFEPAEVNF